MSLGVRKDAARYSLMALSSWVWGVVARGCLRGSVTTLVAESRWASGVGAQRGASQKNYRRVRNIEVNLAITLHEPEVVEGHRGRSREHRRAMRG